MKRRWVRILSTAFVLVAIAGFGAFSTFLFNPFEGKFEYDLASLIPREVDFYLSKRDLRRDFDPFPRPAFLDDLEGSASGEALLLQPPVAELLAKLKLGEVMDELQRTLDGLPVKIDVLQVFGGKDAALAGVFKGPALSEADWAIYGHANWMGKLGVELLRFPDLIGLDKQGVSVEEVGDSLRLSGPSLPRPVFVARIFDVIVASSSAEMITAAKSLEGSRGENSFGQSAKYADYIGLLNREGDELELFVDYRTLAETQSWPKNLPDPYSEGFVSAMTGRLIQVGVLRDLIGILGFDKGLVLRLTALVSSESMNAVQKRFYRERGFDKARALEVAALVPADAGLFAYLHGDTGDLLRELLDAMNDETVELLENQIRAVWDYSDASYLVDDLDTAFKDRAAFLLRDNDYPDEGESGPPHNDRVVPAWALVLWIDDKGKLDEVRDRIVARQADLAIKGREPGSRGVFVNTVQGGYKVFEYWSEFVDGTGHIATVDMGQEAGDYFVLSNSHQMLGGMVKTYLDGGPEYPRLADETTFRSLVNTGLASANVLLWLNPRAVGETTRAMADQMARESAFIDWTIERPRIEAEVLAREFPGRRRSALSSEEAARFEKLAQEAVDAFELREAQSGQKVSQQRAAYRRTLQALEIANGALLELAVDQKRFDLFARIVTLFDEAQAEQAAP